MNIVVLKGRLVRDSEIREFQGGGKVLSNAMALSRVWYDNNGNKHEETDFVDIKANNGTADFIAKWFKKGDGISIKGRLKQESWQDKDTGAKRTKHKIIIQKLEFTKSPKAWAGNSTNNSWNSHADAMAQNIANSGAVMGVSVTNYADSTAGSTADDEETIPF